MESQLNVVSSERGSNFDLPPVVDNRMHSAVHGEPWVDSRQRVIAEEETATEVKEMVSEDLAFELSANEKGWLSAEMCHVNGSELDLTFLSECSICYEQFFDFSDSVIYDCDHEKEICSRCTLRIVMSQGVACHCPICRRPFWWTDFDEVVMEVSQLHPEGYEEFLLRHGWFMNERNAHRNSPANAGSHGEISEDGWIDSPYNNNKRRKKEADTNRFRKSPGTGNKKNLGGFGPRDVDVQRIEIHNAKKEKKKDGCVAFKKSDFTYDATSGLGFVLGDQELTHAQVQASGEKHEDFHAAAEQQFVNNKYTHLAASEVREEIRGTVDKTRKLMDTEIDKLILFKKNDPDFNEEVIMNDFLKQYNALILDNDEKLSELRVRKVMLDYAELSTTFDVRCKMAEMNFEINQKLTEGHIIKEEVDTEMLEFVAYYNDNGVPRRSPYQDMVNVVKVSTKASDKQKLDLLGELVQAPYFVTNETRSLFRKIMAAFASPFYRHWDKRSDKTDWYTGESRIKFMPDIVAHDLQDSRLNKYADRTNINSLLSNYRFIGFESSFIRSLFTNGLGYFERRNFDAWMVLLVHPLIVQRARNMVGARDKQLNSINNIKNELKKEFGKLLPYQVISDSVLVGCQQADAVDYLTELGFKKNKIGEIDA